MSSLTTILIIACVSLIALCAYLITIYYCIHYIKKYWHQKQYTRVYGEEDKIDRTVRTARHIHNYVTPRVQRSTDYLPSVAIRPQTTRISSIPVQQNISQNFPINQTSGSNAAPIRNQTKSNKRSSNSQVNAIASTSKRIKRDNRRNHSINTNNDKLAHILRDNNHSTDRNRNYNRNRLRKFESPCIITWNRGEQYYHCITCSKVKKITICKECFDHSEHSNHNYEVIKSEFNGSCDCGDIDVMTRQLFCKQHVECDQINKKYKTTFNDRKQLRKISTLLDTTREEAKRLAELNKLESVCELSYTGKIIKDYFNNSQVHPNMKINITNVYAVYRLNHEINFKKNNLLNETRMLLWHGTKRANLTGIFDTGLKLPLSNGMFGNGIYFADRVTKSANYTDCGRYSGLGGNTGVLLLCEVAVGTMYEVKTPQNHLTKPPDNYQSVKGLGKSQPNSSCTYKKTKIDVPSGTTKLAIGDDFCLLYNEYIVYDPKRVLIKFFVEFDRS